MDLEKGIYSQRDEQGVINSRFEKNNGRFLEVGAYDPFTFSNTRKLYERGWSGVFVEPSPTCFSKLEAEYKDKDNAVLINAAVAPQCGILKFYDSQGDAISSSDPAHVKKWESGFNCTFIEIEVEAITWDKIFDDHGTDFDFINLDTESTNWELLQIFPFNRCKPQMFCIEFDDRLADMKLLLSNYGYKDIHTTGENLIFWRG